MANTKIPSELVAINAISGTLIADNAITSVHIAENNITAVQIAINAVTALQMADGTITSAKIADGTIVTADIADGQITTGKLADSSVTTGKIAAGTIASSDIANNAILTQHIDDNQITADQIADNAVGVDQLAGITRGSVLTGNAAGNPSLLALGAANTLLQSDGTDLVFAPLQSGIDDNSNAVAITIDSSEQVGIGIAPYTTRKLTVFGTGAGNATVLIEGEGGADPFINFLANNTQHWSLGIDDSDSDKFKLSEHSALGTNDYFVVDTSGNVGIGTTTPDGFYPGAEQLVVHRASGQAGITVSTANNTSGALYFADGTTGSQAYMGGIAYAHDADVLTLVSGGVARVKVGTTGNLYPNVNNTMDLGLTSAKWKDLHLSGNIAVGGTVDGVDIQTLNTTAGAALPKAGGTMTGALIVDAGASGLDIRLGTDKRVTWSGGIGEIGNTAGFQAINTAGSALTAFGIRASELKFATGSATRLTIDASGNVCVGTVHDGAPGLTIDQGMNLSFGTGNDNESYVNFFRQASSAAAVMATGYRYTDTANKMQSSHGSSWAKSAITANYGTVRFYTDAAAANAIGTDLVPTERMRIDSSGKVGIGTASPDAKLTINGAANSEQVIITGNANQSRGLSILTAATGGQQDAKVIFNAQDTENVAYPAIQFETGGTEKIRMHHKSTIFSNRVGLNYPSELMFNGEYNAGLQDVAVEAGHAARIEFLKDDFFRIQGSASVSAGAGVSYTDKLKVNIDSGGILFGSDTAAANTLDDYEEGTWTPTITFGGGSTGQSYNRRQGKYIKIGSLVYIQGHLYFTNKGSSTGQAGLAGLPFPPSSNSSGTFSPIGDRGQLNTGGRVVSCYLQASTTTFPLYDGGFDGSGNSDTNYGDFNNSTEIDVNFCYYTDA